MTAIRLQRAPAGPVRVRLAPGLLQPRTVSRGESRAHVALVAGGAMLLGGDRAEVEVEVEDGCTLEIEDVGGTVAYESSGTASRMDITIRLGDGAHLLWRAHPFVVADRADVRRTTSIRIGSGSSVLLRETLVLGRTGERGGNLRSALSARRADGTPLFVEDLALEGTRPRAGILGPHRVLDSALLLGRRPPEAALPETMPMSTAPPAERSGASRPSASAPRLLHLEQPGAIARSLGKDAHSTGVQGIMERWTRT